MNGLLHLTIVATSLAATVAVALASVTIYDGFYRPLAAKTDRLPLIGDTVPAYVTVETRKEELSVLRRIPHICNF